MKSSSFAQVMALFWCVTAVWHAYTGSVLSPNVYMAMGVTLFFVGVQLICRAIERK